MRHQRRLQSGLLAFIKCDYEIDFHKKRARGWSPETSELSATTSPGLIPAPNESKRCLHGRSEKSHPRIQESPFGSSGDQLQSDREVWCVVLSTGWAAKPYTHELRARSTLRGPK